MVVNTEIHFNDINLVTIDLTADTIQVSEQNHPGTPGFSVAEPLEQEVITSFDEVSYFANNGINVFPNPSDGNFSVSAFGMDLRSVEIFDVQGKLLLNASASGSNFQSKNRLNQGAYLLKVWTEFDARKFKLIVQ